jgi:translation elongation factor EF-G
VKLQLTPSRDAEGYSFENHLLAGTLPERFIPEIQQQRDQGDRRSIVAVVRVLQTFGLASDLSAITHDSGIHSIRFDHYEPVSDERDCGDNDRDSLVGAPRKPTSPDRISAIALPEPKENDHDDDPSLPL